MEINDIKKHNLDAFINILKKINLGSDFDKILFDIVDEIKTAINVDSIVVFDIDNDFNELTYNFAVGDLSLNLNKVLINNFNPLFASISKVATGMYSNNPKEDANFKVFYDVLEEELENIIFMPIRAKRKNIGAIALINKKDSNFTEGDASIISSFTNFISIIITNKQMYHDSQEKAYEVSALYQMTVSANKLDTIEEVLKENMSVICEAFEVHRVSIILKNDDNIFKFKCAIGIDSDVVENGVVTLKNNVLSKILESEYPIYSVNMDNDNRFKINKKLRYNTNSFLSAPMIINDEIIGFVSATERQNNKPFRLKDLHLFDMLVQQITENYNHFKLLEESRIKEKLSAELVFTGNLQQSILPISFPAHDKFDITAKSIPSENVGGDFYDFIELEDNKYAIVVADVSGKGIRAGLFMTMTRSIIRVYCSKYTDVANILKYANKQVYKDSKSGMFVTVFLLIIDTEKKEITYSNAGHLTQYLVKKENNEILELRTNGKPLGVIEDAEYQNSTINYEEGEIIVLFSDGITETFNTEDEEYGEDRIKNILKQNIEASSKDIAAAIIDDTIEYRGVRSQFDDITLIVNKFL